MLHYNTKHSPVLPPRKKFKNFSSPFLGDDEGNKQIKRCDLQRKSPGGKIASPTFMHSAKRPPHSSRRGGVYGFCNCSLYVLLRCPAVSLPTERLRHLPTAATHSGRSSRRRRRSPRSPVAVPGALLADRAAASLTDRGHSLSSLYLPPAALASLPRRDLYRCRQSRLIPEQQ